MRLQLLIAVASASALPALAADKVTPAPTWAQEPTTVLEVKLGAPLSQCPVPMCPERKPGGPFPKYVCTSGHDSPYADRILTLEGLPWRDIAISGVVSLFETKVKMVQFTLDHDYYDRFKAILVERYGPPLRVEALRVTSMAGAEVSSEKLEWLGKVNSLTVIERSGRIDQATVSFSNDPLLVQEYEQQKKKTAADAAKL